MKIYKYQLLPTTSHSIDLPKGATILSFQAQKGVPCIWALVDPLRRTTEERHFLLLGTGHEIPQDLVDRMKYIGTTQMMDGSLVWHLFEVTESG